MHAAWAAQWLEYEAELAARLARPAITLRVFHDEVCRQPRTIPDCSENGKFVTIPTVVICLEDAQPSVSHTASESAGRLRVWSKLIHMSVPRHNLPTSPATDRFKQTCGVRCSNLKRPGVCCARHRAKALLCAPRPLLIGAKRRA